jgi:hypothetical protein
LSSASADSESARHPDNRGAASGHASLQKVGIENKDSPSLETLRVFKLTDNYRAHPEIMRMYSDLFYQVCFKQQSDAPMPYIFYFV